MGHQLGTLLKGEVEAEAAGCEAEANSQLDDMSSFDPIEPEAAEDTERS